MVWKFTKDEAAQGHQDTSNLHALNEFKGQGPKNNSKRTGKRVTRHFKSATFPTLVNIKPKDSQLTS
jgi:hypothetical protein